MGFPLWMDSQTVGELLPWACCSHPQHPLQGRDEDGSGKEEERGEGALPHTQGSSMALAEVWSSPLSDRCSGRPMVLPGKIPLSQHWEDEWEVFQGQCIHVCHPASAAVAQERENFQSEAGREAIQRENSCSWSIPVLFQQHLLGALCRGMKG